MRPRSTAFLLLVLLGTGAALTVAGGPSDPVPEPDREWNASAGCPTGPTEESRERAAAVADGDEPTIVELHPNPTTYGNVGEFLVLKLPEERHLGELTVTDGHASASLPNRTAAGRIALSADPDRTDELTDDPVVGFEGNLRLAADGDALELREGNRTIDAVAYDRAPTAHTWHRTDGEGGVWWPDGATCLPPKVFEDAEVTAFVLPDAPDPPLELLREADERILLAGYTFTSEPVAEELLAAEKRGLEVEVLLEGGPVGGTPERSDAVLGELEAAGVDVNVIGGEGARYSFHHPKYAVVDDRAVVLTENWKPAGTGGAGSRGWGVVVDDPAVATALAELFAADADGADVTSWREHRERATFVEEEPASGSFDRRAEPERLEAEAVEVLVAPDNAEDRFAELLGSAEESILIKQVRIGSAEFRLVEESLAAARRGVEVRILLDSTWYVEEENRELAAELERTAEEEALDLEVRLVEPDGRFEKIHAKGVVVDDEVVVLGSPNWNENAFRENREVAVALHGTEVAGHYAAVFEDDWEGDSWPLPFGLVGLLALALVAAAVVGYRQLRFDGWTEATTGRIDGQRLCPRSPRNRRWTATISTWSPPSTRRRSRSTIERSSSCSSPRFGGGGSRSSASSSPRTGGFSPRHRRGRSRGSTRARTR